MIALARWSLVGGLSFLTALFAILIALQVASLSLLSVLIGVLFVLLLGGSAVAIALSSRILRRVTQAEQRTQARLAEIVESADEAIIGKTLDGEITSWNAGAERIYGYTAKEAIGKNIAIVVPEERGEELRQIFEKLRRGERIERLETVRVRKDGRRIVASITLSPIRDPAGHVIGASTIAFDATERRRAQEALARSEEKFRGLFESAGDGIFVVDAHGSILDVNPAGQALLGRDRAALVGNRIEDLISAVTPSSGSGFVEALTATPPRGNVFEGTVESPDGRELRVQLSAQAVRREGEDPQVVIIARNVTEQSELQRKLFESERAASMGRLASFVAHEINTPLTNIALLTASIGRRVADPDVQTRLKKISAQGRIAATITAELLKFARPRSANLVETDLRDVVQAAADQAGVFRKPGVAFRVELGDAPLPVRVDPIRMQEVFVNLLKNAFEATASGEVAIRNETADDAYWVTVSDTGSGMPPDVRRRLFEPFVTTKAKGEGTGLGLALSKSFVVGHGGDISVATEIGKGSSFTVRLPRESSGTAGDPSAHAAGTH